MNAALPQAAMNVAISTPALNAAAQLFRNPFLKKVVTGTHHKFLAETLSYLPINSFFHSGKQKSLSDILSEIYELLTNSYRCEYVFKNLVAHELYLKKHSSLDTHFGSEMTVGQSRADVAIFNGTSTVYEIKTEYDSFEKLIRQLTDYKTVFDKIYVVVPTSFHAKALRILPAHIGLILVSRELNLSTARLAKSNKANTSPAIMFDLMRQEEHEACLLSIRGYLPVVANADRYLTYKEMFLQLEPEIAHNAMVKQLRYRTSKAYVDLNHGRKFPQLLFTLLTGGYSKSFIEKLAIALN